MGDDAGTAFQSQAYNYIKTLDPYHIVIGASDCADNYIFSDVPSSPVEPTAKLSDAVIGFAEQPHTQLSLDCTYLTARMRAALLKTVSSNTRVH